MYPHSSHVYVQLILLILSHILTTILAILRIVVPIFCYHVYVGIMATCDLHNKPSSAVCEDCVTLVCSDCLVQRHAIHSVQMLSTLPEYLVKGFLSVCFDPYDGFVDYQLKQKELERNSEEKKKAEESGEQAKVAQGGPETPILSIEERKALAVANSRAIDEWLSGLTADNSDPHFGLIVRQREIKKAKECLEKWRDYMVTLVSEWKGALEKFRSSDSVKTKYPVESKWLDLVAQLVDLPSKSIPSIQTWIDEREEVLVKIDGALSLLTTGLKIMHGEIEEEKKEEIISDQEKVKSLLEAGVAANCTTPEGMLTGMEQLLAAKDLRKLIERVERSVLKKYKEKNGGYQKESDAKMYGGLKGHLKIEANDVTMAYTVMAATDMYSYLHTIMEFLNSAATEGLQEGEGNTKDTTAEDDKKEGMEDGEDKGTTDQPKGEKDGERKPLSLKEKLISVLEVLPEVIKDMKSDINALFKPTTMTYHLINSRFSRLQRYFVDYETTRLTLAGKKGELASFRAISILRGDCGVTPDIHEALVHLKEGVELEDPECLFQLGYFYRTGFSNIIPKDIPKGINYFLKALEKGSLNYDLYTNLSSLNFGSNDLPASEKSIEKAIEYLDMGIALGSVPCIWKKAAIIGNNFAPKHIRDDDLALKLLLEAADKGCEDGDLYFNLGLIYFTGRGVPRDWAKSKAFYSRAVALGAYIDPATAQKLYVLNAPPLVQEMLLSQLQDPAALRSLAEEDQEIGEGDEDEDANEDEDEDGWFMEGGYGPDGEEVPDDDVEHIE